MSETTHEFRFARLFDLEDGAQVLLTVETDDENASIQFRTVINGMEVKFSIGSMNLEEADNALQSFTLAGMVEQRNMLIDLFRSDDEPATAVQSSAPERVA